MLISNRPHSGTITEKEEKIVVNTVELKKALLDAGLSQRQLAEKAKISPNALNRKINNRSEFNAAEITILCECLSIFDPARKCAIFLG